MGFFILFSGLAIAAFLACWYVERRTDGDGFGWFLTGAIMAIILFIGSVGVPFSHWEINADIVRFEAIQATLDNSRENDLELEDVAFQMKVAEWNQWLVASQYYNSIWMGSWIPDEVDSLKLIR